MHKKFCLVLAVSVVLGTSSAFAGEPRPDGVPSDVPWSEDIKIVPPGSEVPPEIAGMSGIWCGQWANYLNVCHIIEEVTATGIKATVTNGRASNWNTVPSLGRYKATLTEGMMYHRYGDGKGERWLALEGDKLMVRQRSKTYDRVTYLQRLR